MKSKGGSVPKARLDNIEHKKMKLNTEHLSQVRAYCSRIHGNSHEASDLELLIRDPNDLENPITNLSALKQAFIDSDLPFWVDLMDWACFPEHYREEVKIQHALV